MSSVILESDLPDCETCHGEGTILGDGECPDCHGTGHMDPDDYAEQCAEAAADRWIDHCNMIGIEP